MEQIAYHDGSTESLLIGRLREGDKNAFEILYYQYCNQLKTFAYFELKDKGMAEDAVHDIFLKLWLKRQSLDPAQSIKGFLYTCLKNHILNLIRTRKNELLKNMCAARQYSSSACDTEQSYAASRGMQLVREHVSGFAQKKQAILQMSLFQGLTHDEIANRVNLSVNTVKMYLSHSTQEIKSIIKENI